MTPTDDETETDEIKNPLPKIKRGRKPKVITDDTETPLPKTNVLDDTDSILPKITRVIKTKKGYR